MQWGASGSGARKPYPTSVTHALGSRTSGVDGSSEGGRINTINKLSVAPVQIDGVWCLELSYLGDEPPAVPDHWHGHRVILRKLEPPPSA